MADFGFAEHLELGESNYTLKGSPLYMAPEIVLKRNYDARADLWSIGVILYECLFGRAPYSSKTIEELMARIKKQERIAIPTNAKISGECEDLLTRLLQHDVSKRITFKEFFEHPFLDLKHSPNEQVNNLTCVLVRGTNIRLLCGEEFAFKHLIRKTCSEFDVHDVGRRTKCGRLLCRSAFTPCATFHFTAQLPIDKVYDRQTSKTNPNDILLISWHVITVLLRHANVGYRHEKLRCVISST